VGITALSEKLISSESYLLAPSYLWSVLTIYMLNKQRKYTRFVLCILIITSVAMFNYSSLQTKAIDDFIYSSAIEMKKYVVKGLLHNSSYWFKVGSITFPNEKDVGFAIFDSNKFQTQDKLMTVDNAGNQDEETLFAPTRDGDFYLGVWINDEETGFVTITVRENDTSNFLTIEEYRPSMFSLLRPLWISLGILGSLLIILVVVGSFLIRKSFKNHQRKVAEAKAKGFALPRSGRKKNKCPFC